MQFAELNDLFVTELYMLNDFAKKYVENKVSDNIWNLSDQLDVFKRVVEKLKDAVDARNEV